MEGKGGVNVEEMIPCSLKDQEVFRQVWERVMAGREGCSSPVEPLPRGMHGDLSCPHLEALSRQGAVRPRMEEVPEPQPPTEENPCPEPQPPVEKPPVEEPPAEEPPVEEPPVTPCPPVNCCPPPRPCPCTHQDSDLRPWEESQAADDRTACLRRQVMEALEGWQFYRYLARRGRGCDARTLNTLAGELHCAARKLSAAYFLLTGLRYWPSELLSAPAIPSYWGALRQRFQTEQRQENAFRMAADDWDDPDLQELYNELVEGCQRRCRQLRALLEQDLA